MPFIRNHENNLIASSETNTRQLLFNSVVDRCFVVLLADHVDLVLARFFVEQLIRCEYKISLFASSTFV